jgi:hypothetical protein
MSRRRREKFWRAPEDAGAVVAPVGTMAEDRLRSCSHDVPGAHLFFSLAVAAAPSLTRPTPDMRTVADSLLSLGRVSRQH